MLSQADEDSLAVVYRNLQEKPIAPGHPFYVEIWEHSGHDPVERLRKHIVWTEVQSIQLFSGFIGSGKSTQLLRLQKELTQQGYVVVYANAEHYLNLTEPIEIEELLIVIAGAFSDHLDPSLLKDSYWDRLTNYLGTTEVELKETTFKLPAASFKAELKSSPSFRQRVRKVIQSKLPEVRIRVEQFVNEAVSRLNATSPGQRIVFLFDSFERVKGLTLNEQEVMDSVERLFGSYLEFLQLPFVHCVYSVPAFVQFLLSYRKVELLPTIKLWKKREPGVPETPHEPGLRKMREVLDKRFGPHRRHILGEPDANGLYAAVEMLIAASGGALRDLLRLFREALLSAQSLPLTVADARKAIANTASDFRTSIEDSRWLHRIHAEQAADPNTSKAADVNRYMRLLDSHLVLYYKNDDSWYDTHPLVRDEVDRILKQNPEPTPALKE